jgi:hypothetical protein
MLIFETACIKSSAYNPRLFVSTYMNTIGACHMPIPVSNMGIVSEKVKFIHKNERK